MNRRRSHEPVFWVLFGAGGVVAALTLPALVLVTGLLGPHDLLGEDALAYGRMRALAAPWPGKLLLLPLVALPLWLAAHRIHHSMHDLGVQVRPVASALVCYGLAAAGSALALVTLVRIG
ncbi:MAG: fumarate reductase subunit FrdD [Pseudomonadales bacterium]|jgi:fumarate reductase subunit D|nr:fumarate reductase subunit FrdD [Pseudomonadales bacterium]